MNTMSKSLYSKGGAKKSATKKKFKPHMMYDPKTGKGYKAKVMADHTRMKKKGYGHTKPKLPKAQRGLPIVKELKGRIPKKPVTLKDPIKTKGIKMVYGKSGLGPSPKMADIESFKKNSKKIRNKNKMKMGGNRTNPAKVLGYFNDIKEAKYGAMMNNYNAPLAMMSEGGSCGPGKKRKCKKKFGKRGGKLKKVLRGAGTAALAIGAGIAGSKALKAFKNNGGF
mgnify:CR=1 FL=1|tara:strand:+ start:359 stop:1030 length:672 start_codon:yes stop_codon:yes gene_type:complete